MCLLLLPWCLSARHTSSCLLLLCLTGFVQKAEAESFMDIWWSHHQSSTPQDDWLSQRVASSLQAQLPSSSSFSKDEWLARQQGNDDYDWKAEAESFMRAFLGPKDQIDLAELENSLGSEYRSFAEKRLARIEEIMRPIYNAVPKNDHGLLGHSAVAFILHRVFVVRHGWFVKGLDPEDKSLAGFESKATISILERLPSQIQELFEQHIGGEGATLQELSVLAATLEHLVHKEAMARLAVVYRSERLSSEDIVSPEEEKELLDAYMAVFILGFVLPKNQTIPTPRQVRKLKTAIPKAYPDWAKVQKFVQDVNTAVAPKQDHFYFADVANVVEAIGDRYGTWQDKECRALKTELLAMEDNSIIAGSGRVRLAEFYKKAVYEEKFQFGESVDYLRQLGALDESDPTNPRVLIPNYIHSPSNCVASSAFFSVCCRDECGDLLAYLERQIAQPEAKPSQIIALVSALPSPSNLEGRNGALPQWLVNRLYDVAAQHEGNVPLHSRLFMQWMHFAYPRECAYPHLSGVTSKTRIEDAVRNDLGLVLASKENMISQIEAPVSNITGKADAMWTSEEELIVWSSQALPLHELENDPHVWNIAGGISCLAALSAFAISLLRMCKSVKKLAYEPKMLPV